MRNTALVLIECQNDFLAENGKLHSLVREVVISNNIIENINAAIHHAHTQEILIVHVPMSFSKGHPEVGTNPYGILDVVRKSSAFEQGSWGWEISPEIEFQNQDLVISGKSSIYSFSGTNLDYVLRSHGISRIALGGLLTYICVAAIMQTAYGKGYETYTLTDCMATLGKAEHESAIAYTFPMFSHPILHPHFFTGAKS